MNDLTTKIIGAAIEVHKELGPGLLESTYERCLMHELNLCGVKAERQKKQPICYKGLEIEEGYRIDILVEGKIILSFKDMAHLQTNLTLLSSNILRMTEKL